MKIKSDFVFVYKEPILLLLFFFLTDCVWNSFVGLSFIGYTKIIFLLLFLLILCFFYTKIRPRPILSQSLMYTAIWVAFSALAAIQSYLAITVGRPIFDSKIAAFDVLLGFNWKVWFAIFKSNIIMKYILEIAYFSLIFQVIFSLLTFSFDCESLRNKNLIINFGFSFLICTVLVVFFPAIGPVYYWGYDYQKEIAGSYISDVILLREGYSKIFYFNKMEGVYDFPSFHAVLGVLFIYAHRGLKTFYPFLILNVIMIVAAIPVGGHYLSDILAGIAVAGFTILLTKALEQNKRTKAAKANHTP